MKNQLHTLAGIFAFLGLIVSTHASLQAQNGFPDPGFGTGGEVITPLGVWGSAWAYEVAVQTDGKIVAACSIDYGVALVRYNNDGSIDSDFGIEGVAVCSLECDYTFGSCLVIQPDGKILTGSKTMGIDNNQFGMARFNSNGTIDSTFGEDGIVITEFDCNQRHVFGSLLIQPDGKIIGCGTSECEDPDPTHTKFALIRYLPDGTLDSTFGDDGIVLDELGYWGTGSDIGFAGALQPDGKVVMAGWCGAPYAGSNFALMRWNTDGVKDTTFGENGGVLFLFGTAQQSVAHALCIQNDGKIVACGRVENECGGPSDFGLVRFNSDGSVDSTFSEDGFLTADYGETAEELYAVHQQVDGKLVVSGFMGSDAVFYSKFVTFRYHTDGTLDTEFGTDGMITSDFDVDASLCYGSTIQDDGKIIAAGYTYDINGDESIAIARYASCSAYFTLFPDATPHVWKAVNMAVGSDPMSYVWEWGDGTSSTEPYPSHTYADSGYYDICLTITDGLGCTSTYCDSSTYIYRMSDELAMVTINVWEELPVETETITADFSVTPNPFSDQITIEIPSAVSSSPNAEISIFDLAGNILLTQIISAPQTTINTSQLPTGIYVLSYHNGLEFGTAKLVKME
ncbi:MAG TPA: PKD domain-containing protein [Chitinophagales bacterium]|nr:T9SS type A sorting domain-containing protein [Chitinophagales bacterium]HMX03434.1 PKD domain-containing protein [Chitinophagales bacterium]HNI54565.1 PKD domain-containing protein [Chitinophagales bacterium]HNJ89880.1 PKD domain-containing protein [Chitinophagales bacterium]HNM07999.1 PKD domain-containing protein [Chitinophagales bacterium]